MSSSLFCFPPLWRSLVPTSVFIKFSYCYISQVLSDTKITLKKHFFHKLEPGDTPRMYIFPFSRPFHVFSSSTRVVFDIKRGSSYAKKNEE